jgi:hypothetical protein
LGFGRSLSSEPLLKSPISLASNFQDHQSPAGGSCYLHYPNQIHLSGNIDIIISAPEPEIASEITR